MILKWNQTRILCCLGSTIIPGVQTISKETWETISAHPHIKEYIDEGHIELLNEEVKDGKKKIITDDSILKGMTEPKANALIKETTDLQLLEEWLAKETRAKVKMTLEKQIVTLKDLPPVRGEK